MTRLTISRAISPYQQDQGTLRKQNQIGIVSQTASSSPLPGRTRPDALLTRRELWEGAGVAGLAAVAGTASEAVTPTPQKRPRLACLVSYWGLPTSHADWIVNKLIDGYWWQGAPTPSRVEIASVYIHQLATSLLGQKVCQAKNIPLFPSVKEAVTLGGKELAVDGIVIVAEHGNYPTDLKGHWLLPRWWLYQQVMQVFEGSQRAVPVFNDKHLSYNWDDAKWMFDQSRQRHFPLTGGSSIPTYFRQPAVELALDTPIQNSLVVGNTADEGAIFHCVDVLQAFVDRRQGGETGVRAVQSIRGPEVETWVERHAWASHLLTAVGERFGRKLMSLPERRPSNLCVVEYNDGSKAAVISGEGVGWTYAGEIEGQKEPTIVSMLGWPGPLSQYHAANAHEHWLIEMMLTGKEPYNAERLLLSTGIVNFYMESNWENGRYSAVGRRLTTPFLNIQYRSTHGPLFESGPRPPHTPYLRGFTS